MKQCTGDLAYQKPMSFNPAMNLTPSDAFQKKSKEMTMVKDFSFEAMDTSSFNSPEKLFSFASGKKNRGHEEQLTSPTQIKNTHESSPG